MAFAVIDKSKFGFLFHISNILGNYFFRKLPKSAYFTENQEFRFQSFFENSILIPI